MFTGYSNCRNIIFEYLVLVHILNVRAFNGTNNFLHLYRSNPPSIINLDEYLAMLQDFNCLLLLDNFMGINIPPLKLPLILRNPQRRARDEKFQLYFDKDNREIHTPERLWIKNCAKSKYLAYSKYASTAKYDNCFLIDCIQFSANSKAWSCDKRL